MSLASCERDVDDDDGGARSDWRETGSCGDVFTSAETKDFSLSSDRDALDAISFLSARGLLALSWRSMVESRVSASITGPTPHCP